MVKNPKGTQKRARVPIAGNEERPHSFFQDWNASRNSFHFWKRNEERNALLKIEERLMLWFATVCFVFFPLQKKKMKAFSLFDMEMWIWEKRRNFEICPRMKFLWKGVYFLGCRSNQFFEILWMRQIERVCFEKIFHNCFLTLCIGRFCFDFI